MRIHESNMDLIANVKMNAPFHIETLMYFDILEFNFLLYIFYYIFDSSEMCGKNIYWYINKGFT